jgi:selenide,water dikinase
MGLVPGGAHANRAFFGTWTTIDTGVSPETVDLMFDPQTSGGLLLGIPADRSEELVRELKKSGVQIAVDVGEVMEPDSEGRVDLV